MVWSRDELLEVGQTVRLSESEDEFRLDVGVTGLLASHLQVAYQVLPVSCK